MEEVPPACEEITRDNFKQVFDNYDTILVCVDGVVWRQDGVENIKGAGNVCDWLAKQNKNIFYLSNRDHRTREELRRRLADAGAGAVSVSSIMTAASSLAAAAAAKVAKRKKVFVVGGKGLKAELDNLKVQNIGFGPDDDITAPLRTTLAEARRISLDPEVTHVAIGADPHLTSGKAFKAANYILRGAKPLIVDDAGGRKIGDHVIPGSGAAVAFLRVTLGADDFPSATVFGLPHLPLLQAVREMLPALDPRRTLVIGDSLTEHVPFARDHGLDAALVMTGSTDETQVDAMKHAMRKRHSLNSRLDDSGDDPSSGQVDFRDIILIFVVGGPGCGKGTQCDRLKSEFGLTHISSGDLLREEVASGSALGHELQEIMERGELVPMIRVLEMIKARMLSEMAEGSMGFLIDGYPREEEQAILFESMIRPCHVTIYYRANDDTMLARMRKRALTSGRADDTEGTMRERLKTFHAHSEPVVEYFKRRRKLIEVDAEAEPAAVYRRTLDGLKRMFLHKVAVVFVVGGPGCGKGTQCERLKRAFRLRHISSGDLLRDEVASGSTKGQQLKEIMDKGELVSTKMVLDMIQSAMISYAMLGATGFLLDGFPREESQASSFESDVRRGTCCISYVLDDAEMLRRMRGRAETSGRSDDNEDTMAERLNTFRKHAQPVVNYFKGKEKLIQVYAGEAEDTVFCQTVEGMSKMLLKNAFIIFIVGGPGVGKGTQCAKLADKFSLTHISSGDLIRDEVSSGSLMGKQLHQMMVDGVLIPLETILKLVQCAMLCAAMGGSKGFLIDGFPREERQAICFESSVGRGAVCVLFEAADLTLVRRMRTRRTQAAPPGRADDNEASMRHCLQTYRKHAEAVLSYFRDSKRLVEINAEDKVENVFYETCLALRARGIYPGLHKDDLPACPKYLLDSLGDISSWIYTKPPPKPPTPSTCCCQVPSPSEEQLQLQLRPHVPTIVTIIGSPGTQRSRVVHHVANMFGLLNLDEEVVLSAAINSECDYVRDQVRKAEKTKTAIPWSLLSKLLRKRVDGMKDGGKGHDGGKGYKGIVLGIEARESIFSPPTDELLLDTAKLISDSIVISYLVCPRDALYRKHVLSHVASAERRFRQLNDLISTPNWANVWTKYVKVKFGRDLRKRVQTTDASRNTLAICADVDRHISQNFLRDLRIVFVFGGPGAGKTTLAARLAETFLFKVVDIGQMVEREISSESLLGKSFKAELIAKHSEGEGTPAASSLPFRRVAPLIRNLVVRDVIAGTSGFVVDGFPASEEDAILFAATVAKPDVCLRLKASERTMVERSMRGGKAERESVVFEKVTEYSSSSSSSSFLTAGHLAPLVAEIDADGDEEAVFGAAVETLHKRRIFIPQRVAARLKKKALEEEERLLQNTVILFVVGGPGSGKTLLCDRLREVVSFTPLSTEELFREEACSAAAVGEGGEGGTSSASSSSSPSSSSEVSSSRARGLEMVKLLEAGVEVDLETTLRLLRTAAVKALRSGTAGIIVDGFPNNVQQASEFEKSIVPCTAFLHLEASDSTLMERSLGGGGGAGGGGGGGGERGEEVDSMAAEAASAKAAVKKRIIDYRRGVKDVLEYYRNSGKLVAVDAEETEENIFKNIVEKLRERDIMKRIK